MNVAEKTITVTPGHPLRGTVGVPGDKSLSHRAILFAALAEGESRIDNILVSGVTKVMLDALTALGVNWRVEGSTLVIQGRGLGGLRSQKEAIYCGNSATTMRLLAGALSAAGIPAVLDGSPGLRRRPMGRIVEPLRRMGVPVSASADGTAPLMLAARPQVEKLRPLDETLPVASAQVKSCLLLAALAAEGASVLREPGPSRDHTERMLGAMGAWVTSREVVVGCCYETRLEPPNGPLKPLNLTLPGDLSAAAFLIVAATITPGSNVLIPGVGLNPTRTGLIESLRAMGADIEVENGTVQGGEHTGDLRVRSAQLHGTEVSGPLVVRMIDEFSVFGIAASYADGVTRVRDASELRYKESDRISALCAELRGLGVQVTEAADGFTITGGQVHGGTGQAHSGAVQSRVGAVQSHGDHRMAMALAVAGLAADGPVTVSGAEMIDESFPGFAAALRGLGAEVMEQA